MTGEPWTSGEHGERGRVLLAPNPGLMTLDGTNTWVLREPGSTTSVVVDPGPIEEGHLDLVDETTGDVGLVLLTHHHYDHSEVAAELGLGTTVALGLSVIGSVVAVALQLAFGRPAAQRAQDSLRPRFTGTSIDPIR